MGELNLLPREAWGRLGDAHLTHRLNEMAVAEDSHVGPKLQCGMGKAAKRTKPSREAVADAEREGWRDLGSE